MWYQELIHFYGLVRESNPTRKPCTHRKKIYSWERIVSRSSSLHPLLISIGENYDLWVENEIYLRA